MKQLKHERSKILQFYVLLIIACFGSFRRICQLLRDVAISKDVHAKGGALERSAATGLDAPPEELRAIINQVAIDIHGVYVSRISTEHSYDGLR